MKRRSWLLGCLLLFSIGALWAKGEVGLRTLQQQAAPSKSLDGYVKVCKYLCQTKEGADLLLLYTRPIQQLATGGKDLEQLERETYMLRHRIIVGSVISLLVILLLGSLYARQRQRARIALRLTRKYIDGLESERERMATELHDDVCNNLLALEMNIRAISSEESLELNEQLDLLSNTRERLRTLSHELMPPAFQYATLDEMLADYVLHLSLPEDIHVEYHSTENVDWNIVPKCIGFECYRIVQEAVNNAVKYAGSACIRVELALGNKNLSILVADDGKGFDVAGKTKGIGLRTIRQRAETIGAKVDLTSAPGAGTQLKVNVLI